MNREDGRPRVVVTRAEGQASRLAEELRRVGAVPILLPLIAMMDLDDYTVLDGALEEIQRRGREVFDWVVFTSARGVEAVQQRMRALGIARPNTSGMDEAKASEGMAVRWPRVAAIGEATTAAVRGLGLDVALKPRQAVGEALAEALVQHARRADGTAARFLLVRALEGREVVADALHAAGADVVLAPAYRTVVPEGSIDAVRRMFADDALWPEAVTFTSASTARHFVSLLKAAGVWPQWVAADARGGRRGSEQLENERGGQKTPLLVTIGPVTSAALRELGWTVDGEAGEASVGALAAEVMRLLR